MFLISMASNKLENNKDTMEHMGTRSRTDVTRLVRLGREIAIAESNVWDQKIQVQTTLSRPLQRLTNLVNINLGLIKATPQEQGEKTPTER